MKQIIVILAILLCSFTYAIAETTDHFSIKGVIKNAQGDLTEGANVTLYLIEMASPPKLSSTLEAKSNRQGEFEFANQKISKGIFYRVGAEKDGKDTISEPFRNSKNNKTLELELILPDVTQNREAIKLSREMLIFEQGQSDIRVTRIYHITNTSNSIVDLRMDIMPIKTPDLAKNVMVIRKPEGSEHTIKNGVIDFKLYVKPGAQQIYLTYGLPTDDSSITIHHPILEGINEIEVITPSIGIQAALFPQNSDQVIEQKKTFDKQTFISKTLKLSGPTDSMKVVISGFPTPQYKMMIPAFILLCLLFIGLSYYLLKNAKRLKNKNG